MLKVHRNGVVSQNMVVQWGMHRMQSVGIVNRLVVLGIRVHIKPNHMS